MANKNLVLKLVTLRVVVLGYYWLLSTEEHYIGQ